MTRLQALCPPSLLLACRRAQIPTKIEVFVGFANGAAAAAAGGDGAAAAGGSMRRLGYLSFDSNERSNHQARELKSVHVTVDAELVRLVIHRCHVNKLNIYNQVGAGSARSSSAGPFQPCSSNLRQPHKLQQLQQQILQTGSRTARLHACVCGGATADSVTTPCQLACTWHCSVPVHCAGGHHRPQPDW